jgi:aspartyl-tRNA(Asn)/glutamyl-tRNA(Gln) amidotransferase subunit B
MPLLTLFKTYVGVELHIQLNLSGGKPFTKGITRACRLENSVSVLPIVNKTLILKTNLLRKVIGSNSTKQPFFFDRKNYTYPDLPKGYQITQNYKGFCTNFKFYFFSDYTKKIERFYIQGVQLEEDVASLNNKSFTYNYNRSGFPLIELITDKLSLKNINTVLDFIGAVKSLFVVLKLSTCRMHRGELRCDLNVSTFLINGGACFNRVEVKNLNSSASIKSSLIFEKYRQFVFLRKNLKMYSKLNLLKNVTKS